MSGRIDDDVPMPSELRERLGGSASGALAKYTRDVVDLRVAAAIAESEERFVRHLRQEIGGVRSALACPPPPPRDVAMDAIHAPMPRRMSTTTTRGTQLPGLRRRRPPMRGLGLFIPRGRERAEHPHAHERKDKQRDHHEGIDAVVNRGPDGEEGQQADEQKRSAEREVPGHQ